MASKKAIGTGGAATVYNCGPCKDAGDKREAVARPRVDGKKVALCQQHWNAYKGIGTDWHAEAETFAFDLLAADGGKFWKAANHVALKRFGGTQNVETMADTIRDEFVRMVVADLPREVTPDVANLVHTNKSGTARPVTPADIFNAATRANINFSREYANTFEAPASHPMAPAVTGDSWDADVLDMLDAFDRLVLVAFAESDESDGKAAGKHDARQYAAGECLPNRTVTAQLIAAATRYAAAKAEMDAYATR